MTQIVNCPGCSKQITFDDSPQVQENLELQGQLEQLQKEPKLSQFIPGFRCKDGTCDQVHANSRFTRLPKGKCQNCSQFSGSKGGKCAWCKQNEIEEVDEEELEDLGIKLSNNE